MELPGGDSRVVLAFEQGPPVVLPRGAALVNCARGGHLVDDDLLAALDEGRIESGEAPRFVVDFKRGY